MPIGATIAVVLILINILLTVRNSRQLLMDGDSVAHTHQVQTELLLLRSMLQNAETGQRSFLLTAQERFLPPLIEATANADEQINRLATLTRDNPAQQDLAESLRNAVRVRLATLNELVQLRRNSSLEDMRHRVLGDQGIMQYVRISELIDEMFEIEKSLLAIRVRGASTTFWSTLLTGLSSGVAALVSVACVYVAV